MLISTLNLNKLNMGGLKMMADYQLSYVFQHKIAATQKSFSVLLNTLLLSNTHNDEGFTQDTK
jgi:hypothetical protein